MWDTIFQQEKVAAMLLALFIVSRLVRALVFQKRQ
jgi:hypothetical protein